MKRSDAKKALRTEVRRAERALSPEEKRISDQAIAARVLKLPEYQRARTVFCFVGGPREIDTQTILRDALEQGKLLYVPLCTGDGIMEARRIEGLEQLTPGAYGILEPPPEAPAAERAALDFSLIPCVSCDRAGNRLGQGGGYYDRYFAAGTGNTALLCREALLRPDIPRENHDLAFPLVVTEAGVFRRDGK